MQYQRGLLFGVASYFGWGLSPIYWNWLRDFDPFEMLGYRVLWSLPVLALILTLTGGWSRMRAIYSDLRSVRVSATAGALLAANWGVFIWASTEGHLLDVSLGYYINPLMSVALGVIVLGEHLSRGARLAVGIATAGVTLMAISLGIVPWISLVLAVSFAFYGLLKKQASGGGPVEGLSGEVAALWLPCLGFIAWNWVRGSATPADLSTHALIACSGIVTVVPLLLFGAAAQRIPLSTTGMLQYIAPTLHLIIGIWVYGETLGLGQLLGFGTVWLALAIYTIDMLRNTRGQLGGAA